MIKILFLIHDLGQGGAEKVLVNLVNNLDSSKFDISVVALFGGGVNEQFLKPHIKYRAVWKNTFPGNSKFMKLLTPTQLYKICIKQKYDIQISYLEGPSARIISGCKDIDTKLVSWVHVEQHTTKKVAQSFRSYKEATRCYSVYDQIICVSDYVKKDFLSLIPYNGPCSVLYNTVETEEIRRQSFEKLDVQYDTSIFNIIAMGTLKNSKGFERLLHIAKSLYKEGFKFHLYILGTGPLEKDLKEYVTIEKISHVVTFLGYQKNPYNYLRNADLFVCSSFAEGFSTATTEALLVGTPVCTTNVSGMEEMLGKHNEYGFITDNNEESLLNGIRYLMSNNSVLASYQKKAVERGNQFDTLSTVSAVEQMLFTLYQTG